MTTYFICLAYRCEETVNSTENFADDVRICYAVIRHSAVSLHVALNQTRAWEYSINVASSSGWGRGVLSYFFLIITPYIEFKFSLRSNSPLRTAANEVAAIARLLYSLHKAAFARERDAI